MQPRGTWLVIGAVALVACQGGSQEAAVSEVASDPAVEAAAIMALEREWSAKFQEKDIDWIVNLHATNARQFPPNAEPVVVAPSDVVTVAVPKSYGMSPDAETCASVGAHETSMSRIPSQGARSASWPYKYP